MIKTIYWIQHTHTNNRSKKNNDKDGKSWYKLMNNATYGKTKKNIRKRIGLTLINNDKDYLKCTSKQNYMTQKIFDNNLIVMHKSKLALKKRGNIGMCILELTKELMYEFHYDYIKNKHDNNLKLLLTDTDSLVHEIKTGDVYEEFSSDKEMFYFRNYSAKPKYPDGSNNLVIGKIKDEIKLAAIKEFLGFMLTIYSFLV